MIGDRHYDIRAAKAFGFGSVGVLWGYGSREELEEAGADYIAERPEDILEWLGDSPRRNGGACRRVGSAMSRSGSMRTCSGSRTARSWAT